MDDHYQEYRKFLYQYFIKHVKISQIAEDLTQDVLVKYWIKKDSLKSADKLDAWLFSLARNHLFDHYRRLAVERKYQKEIWREIQICSDNISDILSGQEMEEKLENLLNELPPRQEEVFRLSRLREMSIDEISLKLNLSPNTVKNHLVKALKVIRSSLKPN